MKLTNLSIAILIALGTVACGGSDNNSGNNNPPADPPAPQPKPETPPADNSQKDSKIVDPTETHVVDGRDLSKDSTVGGLQYIRRESSDYDRVYNPDKMASATPLLGVSLNEQNPKLTNIVLARRDLEREENKGVRAQFAGSEENEPLTHAGKEREQPSLQIENFKNVDILAGAFKQVGSAVFADPSNRLDPVTHNIDTHIQNNTDKSGEFTRERVTHVYTPRYEYRQPFVDYPNAANSADNRKEADGDKTIATKAPAPPGFPDINALESALYGSNGSWSTEDANDNSRHPVNTGTDKDRSFGSFSNERDRYGNFPSSKDDSPTDPANIADAKAWRNKGTRTANGTAVPQTRSPDREGNHYYSDAKTDNVVDWQGDDANLPAYKGTITRAQAITRTGANTASYTPSPDSTYNYQQSWPNGAYPQYPKKLFAYPNDPYDEPGNNALNGGSADGDPKNHEHIYLEREEFTAIRQLEPIRPLVNPIANEWDWTLYQVWDASVKYHKLVKEERERIIGTNPDGTPKKEKYEVVVHDQDHTAPIGDSGNDANPVQTIQARLANLSLVDPQCSGRLVTCTKLGESYSLKSANWHTPDNKGGGIRGEFRGPAYVGYHEDLATIRFADDRIWKAGTPGYKQEYEKKYGANLIWWSTQDSAFENHATSNGWNPRARRVDINTKASNGGNDAEGLEELIWAKDSGNGNEARDRDVEIQPTGDITNGLIRIGYTARTGKMPTLGQELKWEDGRWKDHHNTTSRIFG
ncbi:transferrin-binding protein-like solute binding protein, partial [Cardiobacterium hominis]